MNRVKMQIIKHILSKYKIKNSRTKNHDILLLLKCLDQVHIIKMLERKSFLKLMKNYSMN
jgi:hypothetical protein